MKNDITILYIDDNIDYDISYYLKEYLKNERYIIIEKEFHDNENLEDIINSDEVKSADIILIDSKLFEKKMRKHFLAARRLRQL